MWLFDYRTWGGSEGLPRHLVSANDHVADYRAAVAHIKVHLWACSAFIAHAAFFSVSVHSQVRQHTAWTPSSIAHRPSCHPWGRWQGLLLGGGGPSSRYPLAPTPNPCLSQPATLTAARRPAEGALRRLFGR